MKKVNGKQMFFKKNYGFYFSDDKKNVYTAFKQANRGCNLYIGSPTQRAEIIIIIKFSSYFNNASKIIHTAII